MSTREGQHGHITFTRTGYTQFVRDLRARYNAYQDRGFDAAQAAYALLNKIEGRGSAQARRDALEQVRWVPEPRYTARYIQQVTMKTAQGNLTFDGELTWPIKQALFRNKAQTLLKPRRSDFPRLTNKVKAWSMEVNELYVTLTPTDSGGELSWHIEYGSNNVRHANSTRLSQLVLEALAKHPWKRGEGGVFYSDDEHSQDAAIEHHMPYESAVSERFGPLGATE
jgi:hypothetical protein